MVRMTDLFKKAKKLEQESSQDKDKQPQPKDKDKTKPSGTEGQQASQQRAPSSGAGSVEFSKLIINNQKGGNR